MLSIEREIVISTKASASGNGGNGWGAHKQRIVRTTDGSLYCLVVEDDPNTADPQAYHKQFVVERVSPTGVVSEVARGVSGREASHLLRRPDDSLIVITWNPDVGPAVYDVATKTSMPIPGAWDTGFYAERWPYSAASIDAAGNIWVLQERISTDANNPDKPAVFDVGFYDATARSWTVTPYTIQDYRHSYQTIFPRLDLGPGGFTWVGERDATFAELGWSQPAGDGSGPYVFDGVGFFKHGAADSFKLVRFEPQNQPLNPTSVRDDHPQYAIADAMRDNKGRIHVLPAGSGVFFAAVGGYGGEHLVLDPDTGVVLSQSFNPCSFQNQTRITQDGSGAYWVARLGSPYPVPAAGAPLQLECWTMTDDFGATYGGHQLIACQTLVHPGGDTDKFFWLSKNSGSVIDPNVQHAFVNVGNVAVYVQIRLAASTPTPVDPRDQQIRDLQAQVATLQTQLRPITDLTSANSTLVGQNAQLNNRIALALRDLGAM